MEIATTINKDKEYDIANYLAFARWICGIKVNGKVYEIDDIRHICEAYKLYDYSVQKRKTNKRNNKIKAINYKTNETIVFENRKEASLHFGYRTPKTITTYISKNIKAKGEWHLSYFLEEM